MFVAVFGFSNASEVFFRRGYLTDKLVCHQEFSVDIAYFPRRDTPSSQDKFHATQLRHGCISSTLHRTRRALQAKQAFFARVRGRSGAVVAIIDDQIGCL